MKDKILLVQIGDKVVHRNGQTYEVRDVMIGVVVGEDMVHKAMSEGGKLWYYAFPTKDRSWSNCEMWREASEFVSLEQQNQMD